MKNFLLSPALIAGLATAICLTSLAYLNIHIATNLWLIPSFGASLVLITSVHSSPLAQPKNIFFGHIISMLVGVIFNETLGFSFYSLGLSVGVAVTLMVYLKVMHPPAASNPLVALFMDLSFDFILFPVIAGTIVIIFMSILINRIILKRKYPKKSSYLKNLKL